MTVMHALLPIVALVLSAGQAAGKVAPSTDISTSRARATGSSQYRTIRDHLRTLPDAEIVATGATVGRTFEEWFSDESNAFGIIPRAYHAGIKAGTDTHDVGPYLLLAAAAGKKVRLPPGTYNVSTAVASSASQMRFLGSGRGITIVQSSGSAQKIFDLSGTDIEVAHMTLDGTSMTDGDTGAVCLNMVRAARAKVHDLEVKNCGYYGINPYEVNDSVFESLWLHDNYRHGIHPSSDHAGYNVRNSYRGIAAWNQTASSGFDDRGVSVTPFPYEQTNNVYEGIVAWNNGATAGGKSGIVISNQRGVTATNLQSWGNATYGLFLSEVADFHISNLSIRGNGWDGVYAYKVYDGSISGATFDSNGAATTGKRDGILFTNGASEVYVTDAVVIGTTNVGFAHSVWGDLQAGRSGKVYYRNVSWQTATPFAWDGSVQAYQVVREGGHVADGASAVAFQWANDVDLVTTGAKIAAWYQDAARFNEVCSIDKDGLLAARSLSVSGTSSFTGAVSASSITASANVNIGNRLRLTASPGLGTCDSSVEGSIFRQSGGTTGARTKLCFCTSDGAGSPAYAWKNISGVFASDAASIGNATTCP